jgi:hypothetical protein
VARRIPVTIAVAVALAIGLGVWVPHAIAGQQAHRAANNTTNTWVAPSPMPTAQPGSTAETPAAGAKQVSVSFSGEFLGWAMLDRMTGDAVGNNMDRTSSTESMIKTWLVADFLRRAGEGSKPHVPTAAELETARQAIRWSDDDAAQDLYEANGGNSSIQRMIQMCSMTETTVYNNWWSRTQMSPLDAVRLGECLENGKAAGPDWTDWLLGEMRQVQGTTAPSEQEATRGGGHWGIIDGVPASQATTVAIKNGWTSYQSDGNWHVNCLAVTNDWAIAVMMRYPSGNGLEYGAEVCQSIAAQLLT